MNLAVRTNGFKKNLCLIYKQAGATSCDGNGESALDMVVEWPDDHVPLSTDRLKRLDKSMNDIQNVLSVNGIFESGVDIKRLATGTGTGHMDSMNERMGKIEDKMAELDATMKGKMAELDATMKDKMAELDATMKDKVAELDVTMKKILKVLVSEE
jgi:hypothetical protein